jgi:hypothetical protein
MKKIIIAVGCLLSIVGCSTYKSNISKSELDKWSTKNDTIYYTNKSVAFYDHCEYELNPNHGRHAKPIQELSITQLNFEVTIDNLIAYIHTVHPRQKVEIVVPRH